jgi:hypothetical protein
MTVRSRQAMPRAHLRYTVSVAAGYVKRVRLCADPL